MIRLADRRLPAAQAVVVGRVFDTVSDRGLTDFHVTLTHAHPGGTGQPPVTGTLPLLLAHRTDGWFALYLADVAHMPDLTAPATVTLTARVSSPGRDAVELSQDVPGPDLAVVDTAAEVGGAPVVVPGIPAAPWSFSVPVPPRAVALAGIVLRDHDPDSGVAGVSVVADGSPPVVTGADGRFFLPALPVLAVVTLTLTGPEGGPTQVLFRPDYDRPVDVVTLSLPH
jgi:hypothetical protein